MICSLSWGFWEIFLVYVIIYFNFYYWWIMARVPRIGGSDVVNCGFLRRFVSLCD